MKIQIKKENGKYRIYKGGYWLNHTEFNTLKEAQVYIKKGC